MVICKSQRFIFLRVPKNASTSLATFFIRGYCDSDDIYTGVGDSGINRNNISENIYDKYRKHHRMIHLTLNEIIQNKIVDEKFVRSCKMIGVLREPLDRQLSLYFFKTRGNQVSQCPDDFRRMFRNGCCDDDLNNEILQSDYLKIGDQSVGEWWLYEDLNERLAEFQTEYQPKTNVELPTYKSSFRKNVDKQKLIDEYYDDETREAVLTYYNADAKLYERLKGVRS